MPIKINMNSENKNGNKKINKSKVVIFGILIAVLVLIFVPIHTTQAWFFTTPSIDGLVDTFFKAVGYILMTISAFILTISGWIFDRVITFTIVDMAANIGGATRVGGSITNAWATLRDVANMCFIFVLLFAAFKAMFELSFGNLGTTIRNIIIVALLINFSLFFSKVVIDASNIVSVGFYNAIVNQEASPLANQSRGISTGYMNMLGLQTFYDPNLLNSLQGGPTQIMTVGIMSSVFMLITAVILLTAGIMFVARFIILVFLMILSPLALIAYIIPGAKGQFEKWKGALLNQSFFAPLYFALTWVVFKLGNSLGASIQNASGNPAAGTWSNMISNPQGVVALILNYVLIIGFSIAALVFAKQMATSGAMAKPFNAITGALGANKVAGAVGGVTLGSAAALGRRTIGAAASRLAESRALSGWAARSAIGQKVKEGAEKTAKSSFDIRQTKTVGDTLQRTPLGSFGAGKKGGYNATLADQNSKKERVSSALKTDQDRQVYAQRVMGAIGTFAPFTRWYKQGGSRSGHAPSLFGTMGRSDRITASKIFNSQIQPLQTQLTTLQGNLQNQQNRDTALNQQLNTAQGNLIALQNIPQANRQGNWQQQVTNIQNNINNINNQITQNQNNMTATQNQINAVQPMVQNLQNQINNLGLTNTAQTNPTPLTPQQQIANAAAQAQGQPLPHQPRGQRADEQNY